MRSRRIVLIRLQNVYRESYKMTGYPVPTLYADMKEFRYSSAFSISTSSTHKVQRGRYQREFAGRIYKGLILMFTVHAEEEACW